MRFLPSNAVFLAGFIAYVAIRGAYIERAKGGEIAVSRADWVERLLLFLVFVGSLLLPVVYLFTPWLAFADYGVPTPVFWAGAVLMVPALLLFWRAHADLGRNWSATLEVRRDHSLVRHGVYRSVRHPMYAAILLWGLAQGMLLRNWLAGWSALATFTVMFLVRTPREERMMLERFGQEYRDYVRTTGRLLPRRRRAGGAPSRHSAREAG